MDNHPTTLPIARPRRLPLFLIGCLLFLIGPAINAAQILQGYLEITPWYLPALSTLGVVCMIASVWQRGGVLRCLGLGVFVLLCGLEWLFVGVLTRTPIYEGPATVGNKVPTFAASLADGTPFTNQDLEAGQPTVLLFYRGHW